MLLGTWFFHLEQGSRPFAAFSVPVGRADAKHFLELRVVFQSFTEVFPHSLTPPQAVTDFLAPSLAPEVRLSMESGGTDMVTNSSTFKVQSPVS